MKLHYLMVGLVFILMLIITTVNAAKPIAKTGFDVVIESYGYQLLDYDITDKFKFTNDDQFIAMEIYITNGEETYTLYWIMKKERYNELKEKV